MNLRFYAATATAWCRSGHEVGWDQISTPAKTGKSAKPKAATQAAQSLTPDERNGIFTVKNDAFYLVVSRATGLEALRWQEQDVLISGPRLQIWRGPTDNDGIKDWTDETWRPLSKWRALGLDKLAVKTVSAKARRNKDGSMTFFFEHLGACVQADNTFTIDKAIPDLPRLGVVLTLKPAFEKIRWFGRGPFENYSDRKRAALIDLYESTVTDQYVPDIMPQEHGNHTDVRWLSLAFALSYRSAAGDLPLGR